MTWLNGLSDQDKKEMYEDNCAAYQAGAIGLLEFTLGLSKLGYNATDIAEAERFYRPNPPEEGEE